MNENGTRVGAEGDAAAKATEERRFRDAMAQLPAGVTVAAADDGVAAHGVTVSSFTSVSLDPPLCLICLNARTPLLPILRRSGRFAVHILTTDQEHLARLFAAAPAGERRGALFRAAGRPPRLAAFLARFDLALEAEHPAGDHIVVIGRVLSIERAPKPTAPLTWWRSSFGALAPRESGA